MPQNASPRRHRDSSACPGAVLFVVALDLKCQLLDYLYKVSEFLANFLQLLPQIRYVGLILLNILHQGESLFAEIDCGL